MDTKSKGRTMNDELSALEWLIELGRRGEMPHDLLLERCEQAVVRLRKIKAAARELMPLIWEDGMEGESVFERAVIKLAAALNEAEPK